MQGGRYDRMKVITNSIATCTLVTEVGDGSTSTVVAAHYIYEKLIGDKENSK